MGMKNISSPRTLLILCTFIIAATACSKSSPVATHDTVTTPAKHQESVTQKYLRMTLDNEPTYLDPGLSSEASGVQVAQNLFEGLLTPDARTGKPMPGVATSWKVSKDLLTYTFELRKDAQWSDGTPVTAHDFVYAWRRVLKPETGSTYAFALYYLKNAQALNMGEITNAAQLGVRAVSDHQLEFVLEAPTPFILDWVSRWVYAPVPRHVVEKHGAKWTLPEHIVSNGPFVLESWSPHKEIILAKNPRYHASSSTTLDGVHFHTIESRETALKMYRAGELDVAWNVPEIKVPSLIGTEGFVMHPFLAADFFRVNTTRAPFTDVRVRQALALAIDRETLANKYLQKMKIPSAALVPPGVGDYESPQGLQFNPERAQRLLAEAGYPEGKGFPEVTLDYNTNETLKLMAQVVQQMWKQHLGVTVKLQNQEYKTLISKTTELDYDIIRSRWIGDYVDPNTYLELFTSSSSINNTGWKSEDYDTNLSQAMRAVDPIQRLSLMHRAESLLLNSAAVIPLYVHTKAYMKHERVEGFYPDIIDYHPLQHVRIQ